MKTCGNMKKYLLFELAWFVWAHMCLYVVYMLTNVCSHMGRCERLCGGPKLTLGVLNCSPLFFLKQGRSLNLGLSSLAGVAGQ